MQRKQRSALIAQALFDNSVLSRGSCERLSAIICGIEESKQSKAIEAFVMAEDAKACLPKLVMQYPKAEVYIEPTRELARAKVLSLQDSGVMALSVEYGGCSGFEHGN